MPCNPIDWVDGPHRCIMDGWLDQASELQFALMLSIVVAVPLYVKYEDPVPSAIGLLIVSAILFPILPGQAAGIAWLVLFFAIVVSVFSAIYKTSL